MCITNSLAFEFRIYHVKHNMATGSYDSLVNTEISTCQTVNILFTWLNVRIFSRIQYQFMRDYDEISVNRANARPRLDTAGIAIIKVKPSGIAIIKVKFLNHCVFNPYMTGNAWLCIEPPGHKYPHCWLNIHRIRQISYRNITVMDNNITCFLHRKSIS